MTHQTGINLKQKFARLRRLAVGLDDLDAASPEIEGKQLRQRITELETELVRLQGYTDGRDSRNTAVHPHEDEAQYKEAFDNVSICMFLVDVTPDGRFKFAGFNAAEEKAVGLTSAEVSGRFVEDVFAADLAKHLIGNYRRCVESDRPINYDDELNFSGERRYFHSDLIPIRNTAGRIQRIVGACIDITDLKLRQEADVARQKLESLGTLAAGIAHDFNNLLAGVLSQTELASSNLSQGAAPEEELKNIRAIAVRGAEIVRQLMAYAGQEMDTLELVDVPRLVEESIELLQVTVSKHAALRLELARDVPRVLANPSLISQILINVVTNASEAIGERDGVIEIATARTTVEAESSATSSGLRAGDYLQLQVSDTGRGMTPQTRARVFDPFFTKKAHGRGLGLAIVQGIVKRLGGTITVRSEPGHGTTFRVLLPGAINGPVGRHDRDTVPAKDRREAGGCILLVEDEAALRLAVSRMLRREGFTTLECADGTDALATLRTHSDDVTVMLLDVTLPGIASTEVLREAKRLRPDLAVILTSAYSKQSVDKMFADFGPQRFLRKPYRLADFLSMLETEVETGC